MSCATVVLPSTYVSPFAAQSHIPSFYEPSSTQIPETHEPKVRLVDRDKYATVIDEVFDETSPSNVTAMHSQFSNDEAQLVPHVGRDSFMPKVIGQIDTLSIDSKISFDAMKINFDSGDGESEEDRRGCTKVEENLSNGADQVVDKNPQQNTNEQLIRFAPMIMDLFATLVPGTYAEEEWTSKGIADTITILISYMRMSISVCITLGDNPCLSSSYNSLRLNDLTD
ncbi:uncharacterized protein LOC107784383 isoform X1 [Nicotiana tabacum]|uniref:Uncharacterized protein LOC107784383 isoform X1 n=1 Tax=Nicotiana tabacum TaxID=4097 RepID=A0A1S3Z969_TOBAC|nr:PREDICTED: uncharacterized protein LOC107784383 isoform X1 [Nicotiana tabacum]